MKIAKEFQWRKSKNEKKGKKQKSQIEREKEWQ